MEKVLLHSCCAPCSAAILEWMGQNGYEPTIFFYNPNIFPEEEYLKRKHEIVRYAKEIGVAIVDLDGENTGEKDNAEVSAGYEGTDGRQGSHGDFWERQHEQWLECHGFPLFTTTLASSRWKDIRQINEAGFYAEEHCGRGLTRFWDRNWRKGGLYERRNILARRFYNQQYCGCEFSLAHHTAPQSNCSHSDKP